MVVEPATLSFDAHGVPMSALYGDVYASRDGALGQARHVFLGGSGCVERWRDRAQFVILENGFGLGVNFLATWQAWHDDPMRPQRLHYVAIERHPLPAAAFVEAVPAELRERGAQLAARWPLPIAGLHRCEFEAGRIVLTLAFGDARAIAPELRLGADSIFLDGFAPDRNPEMWDSALLRSIARFARADCRAASWCTARPVRESLAAAGFEIELQPGFASKRQMLTARYAPRYVVRRREPPMPFTGTRAAVVVGAGLAGSASADALARRGWNVTVVDSGPMAAATSLPWGLMHPLFAADDNLLARLTRAGAAATTGALERVAPGGSRGGDVVWRKDGFFQAVDDGEGERWRSALGSLDLPREYVDWLSVEQARDRLGLAPARGGLWWPHGCVVSPPRWIRALLAAPSIRFVQAAVGAIEREGGDWVVRGPHGNEIARAPAAVIAAAGDSPRLLASTSVPVQAVPGQVTFVEAEALHALRAGLGGDGTMLHAPDGQLAVGATYETPLGDSSAPLDERMAARSNLARLERLLAEPVEARVCGQYSGVRCVARDRVPYAGAVADEQAAGRSGSALRGAHCDDLPRRPGLFASFALGSRGLTLAALAAELIAAHAEGEPLPLERALADAIDPGRVLLKRLRRSTVLRAATSSR